MKFALLLVGAIIGAQWYKFRNSPPKQNTVNTGTPIDWDERIPTDGGLDSLLAWGLPEGVPMTDNQPITEAAYHQYPTEHVPATGYEPNNCLPSEVL